MNDKTENDQVRRSRPDSKIGSLKPEQRQQVDHWLFRERLPYGAVVKNCLAQFCLKMTVASVCRYYQRRVRERNEEGSAGGLPSAPGQNDAALSPQQRYERVLDGIEKKAMELIRRPLAQLKVRELCDAVHVLIAARREANEANRLELVRQKAEYDVAAACVEHKVEFDRICADDKLDDGQRLRAIREELFGPELPE